LYPASPEPPVSVDGLQLRFTWLQLAAVAVKPVGTDGGVVSAAGIFTIRLTTLEVEMFPAVSYAFAVQLCVPLFELVNDHAYVYGLVVSVPLSVAPS
jgi:hypothetical protein